ncbi:MAG: acyl-CoA thioesterase [Ruminococcaceae bacterium]|nr:acyl-CoA thioesterase [Oscillospiraceae bacterium]
MTPYVHKVAYYETDRMGIVHHSNYIRIMEEARLDFLSQIGFGYDEMEKNGVISPVTAVAGRYKKTTTYPDEISVVVTVTEASRALLKLGYEMKVGDTVAFTGESEHCFLGQDGRILNMKKSMPEFYETLLRLCPAEATP